MNSQNFSQPALQTCYPRISIITPSFNSDKYIEQTLKSVISQKYPNLEYIVIDGGSSDNTVRIIKEYGNDLAHWLSEPDSGQSEAINKGIRKASGDWIAWLNADDILLPNALLTVGETIKNNEQIAWVVGTTVYIDEKNNEIGKFNPVYHDEKNWLEYVCTKRSGIALPQPSSFWKREAVMEAGLIDEDLKYAMDHDLYWRLAKIGLSPHIIDAPLAGFRIHPNQKTAHYPTRFFREEKKITKKLIQTASTKERKYLLNYLIWFEIYILKQRVKRFIFLIIKKMRQLRKRLRVGKDKKN